MYCRRIDAAVSSRPGPCAVRRNTRHATGFAASRLRQGRQQSLEAHAGTPGSLRNRSLRLQSVLPVWHWAFGASHDATTRPLSDSSRVRFAQDFVTTRTHDAVSSNPKRLTASLDPRSEPAGGPLRGLSCTLRVDNERGRHAARLPPFGIPCCAIWNSTLFRDSGSSCLQRRGAARGVSRNTGMSATRTGQRGGQDERHDSLRCHHSSRTAH